MEKSEIKANFDRIRKEKGLRVEDIAERLNVSRVAIAQYFSVGGLTLTTLNKLADALGVELAELVANPSRRSDHNTTPRITCPYCGRTIAVGICVQQNGGSSGKQKRMPNRNNLEKL